MSRSIEKIAQELLRKPDMIKVAQDHKLLGRALAHNALSRYIKLAAEEAAGEEMADDIIADAMAEQAEETPELIEGGDDAIEDAIGVLTDEEADEDEQEEAVDVLVEELGGEEAVEALMENIASELEGYEDEDDEDEEVIEDVLEERTAALLRLALGD